MIIDIAICTYNRPEKVAALVSTLINCQPPPNSILVIDASDEGNTEIDKHVTVRYFKSNHKNQPYQRYIAFQESDADVLVYIDDDMEVIDENFIQRIIHRFENYTNDVAIALHFKNKQQENTLANIPSSQLLMKDTGFKIIVRWFTAYPEMPIGKFGLCGNRGKQPSEGGYTELISGGAFAARRKTLYQNFNFQLFDLFEEKLGMGEDGILGYTLSKQGKIWYEPQLLFCHNDEKGSHYAANHTAYAKRVLLSRLFLSMEKARLDGTSLAYAKLHYIWYGFWRCIGYGLNFVKARTVSRKEILIGSWEGYKKAINFNVNATNKRQMYWHSEYLKTKK